MRSSEVDWKTATKKSPSRSLDVANNTFTAGFDHSGPTQISMGNAKKKMKQLRKENGWDNYVKPISKYNEQVHPSMKITFERI